MSGTLGRTFPSTHDFFGIRWIILEHSGHVIYYYFVLTQTFYELRVADNWLSRTIVLLLNINVRTSKTKLCLRMKHIIIVCIGT